MRDFKEWTYQQLEQHNINQKCSRLDRTVDHKALFVQFVTDNNIKAVTVCFTDIEGRFHTLDYDQKYFVLNCENLTFDGSSIRGFTNQSESDLRLGIDWNAWYLLPSDIFAPGKVLIFSVIENQDGTPYESDLRGRLRFYLHELAKEQQEIQIACEIEGFLFAGVDAEKQFMDSRKFEFATQSGYFDTLPRSLLRKFIDRASEAQRSLGFENEKDHGEVACSQFEMNWRYTDALIAADQVQLYKIVCRQIAHLMGCTASFLPKPMVGVNGNGMHTNLSVIQEGKNLFYDPQSPGMLNLSRYASNFAEGIISKSNDLCLIMNPSVNAYRRLDPAYEAPNRAFVSAVDRGAMIRVPLSRSSRIEVRSISPDANPYLLFYSLIMAGMSGIANKPVIKSKTTKLPSNIYTAARHFERSKFIEFILGVDTKKKYLAWKLAAADRCPKLLGSQVKIGEIIFHHEVTNQHLWQKF